MENKQSNLDSFYENVCHLPKKYLVNLFEMIETYQKDPIQNKELLASIGKYMALNNAEPEEIENEDIFSRTSPLESTEKYVESYIKSSPKVQQTIKNKLLLSFPIRILKSLKKSR